MSLAHQILVGIKTTVNGICWGGVCMCQQTVATSSVKWAHGRLATQDNDPPHSNRPLEYDRLVGDFCSSTREHLQPTTLISKMVDESPTWKLTLMTHPTLASMLLPM